MPYARICYLCDSSHHYGSEESSETPGKHPRDSQEGVAAPITTTPSSHPANSTTLCFDIKKKQRGMNECFMQR